MSTTDISHWTKTTCYGNGIKRQEVLDGALDTVTVENANGDVCYRTVENGTGTEEITDGAGNLVAHVEFGDSSARVMISCDDGSVTTTDLSSSQCVSYTQSPTCASGACSW